MTTVDDTPDTAEASVGDPRGAGKSSGTGMSPVGRGVRGELLLALELVGLCAFAFSRPVLDSFGRSPETFVARDADLLTFIEFGLLVTLVPVVVAAALGGAFRAFGPRVRWRAHLALLGTLGGVAAWRLAQDITGYPGSATKVTIAGLLGVPAFVIARRRVPGSRSFLRYAGAASVLFLVLFLFASPASSVLRGDGAAFDSDAAHAVASALGDDAPPIVFVVTDTFPTQALVDGTGHIDGELYPNIAALASTSTWYRNSTTVSGFTNEAVPALLSGLYPKPSDDQQFGVPYPNNLFTLFGSSHDMHVHEPMTRLCPDDLCGDRQSGGVGPLIGDAIDLWRGSAEEETAKLDIPGLFLTDRYAELEAWIDRQDFSGGDRPGLYFYHAMLPHEPWSFLPDGSVYEASDPPAGVFANGWSNDGHDVGLQRLVLQAQATDRLLGRMFDRMRAAGTFDDALIVVAADHGQSFVPGEPWREIGEGNYEPIMWAPLIIKAPGQAVGEISDDNIETVDVLPTVADRVGLELPFPTDGVVAGGGERRHPDVKVLDDVSANELRAPDGEPRVEVDAGPGLDAVMTADPVRATGADAVWRRTAYGDLVGRLVADLPVGDDVAPGSLTLEDVGRFDDIDLDEPLPIEVLGRTGLPSGTVVAFALNDTIAGVTEVGDGSFTGQFVQSLLLPRLFRDGANELAAFVVDGPVGSESLRPVAVDGSG